jgi:hypothetical protein
MKGLWFRVQGMWFRVLCSAISDPDLVLMGTGLWCRV